MRSRRSRYRFNLKRFLLFGAMLISVALVLIWSITMARQNNKHDTKIVETGIDTTRNILSDSSAKNELTKTAVHQTPSTDSKISVITDSTGAADSNSGGKTSGSVPKNTDAAGSNKKNADKSSDPIVSQKAFKDVFKKDVFIGDSITQGLSFFEFLDEQNVYAKLGVSLSTAQAEIEEAEKLQPENVFLLFGLNDVVDPGTSEKAFAKSYKSVIDSIKKRLPKSNIYVQSVLPVLQKATDKKPALNNERINKFNTELINLCQNEKVTYLDISVLAKGNQKLYQGDGIHFMQQFYTSWLYYIEKKVKTSK